jgi:hypothetical protein
MIYERRLNFCMWLIEMDAQNPTFIERILLLRKLIFLVLWRTINLGRQISDISKKSMQATIYCHYD